MDRFLDRNAFSGQAFDAAASCAGEARFSGCFACTNWPRATLQDLLPAELMLAPNVSTTPDVHPLLFIFGEQREGAIVFGGMNVPMGVHYSEFGLAIPYVTHRAEHSLHTYVPRMYSSAYPAVRDANVHYGFRKELARLEWHGPIVTLTTAAGALVWHAAVEPAGAWNHMARALPPTFAALRAALSLPVIGRKQTGRYVRSSFDLGVREGLVRPVRCAVSIDAPLVEGLVPQRCYSIPGGAFEVRGMLWRLSWPEPCW